MELVVLGCFSHEMVIIRMERILPANKSFKYSKGSFVEPFLFYRRM